MRNLYLKISFFLNFEAKIDFLIKFYPILVGLPFSGVNFEQKHAKLIFFSFFRVLAILETFEENYKN